MVFFVCSGCGESLKMGAVVKHHCYAPLSCIDCNKDFTMQTYKQHNSCMSEAQRYQGHLYKAGKAKKVDPQELWTESIAKAAESAGPRHKNWLQRLIGPTNVPRKLKQFINFARNSLRIGDEKLLTELHALIDAVMPKKEPAQQQQNQQASAEAKAEDVAPPVAAEENGEDKKEAKGESDKKASKKRKREEEEEEAAEKATDAAPVVPTEVEGNSETTESFNLKKRILAHLKSNGGKLKTKRLRKTVVDEALAAKALGSTEDAEAAFDKYAAKLVKKAKIGQDAKFTVLSGAATAAVGEAGEEEND